MRSRRTIRETVETVPAADRDGPLARVLVVEHDAVIALEMRRRLQLLGAETTGVTSGEQAMTLVRKRRFDLIILGINLPGIIGLEVCRRLKMDAALKTIPVIFLSGETSRYLMDIALGFGAVDYLTKPYETEDFNTRVRAHLPSLDSGGRMYLPRGSSP